MRLRPRRRTLIGSAVPAIRSRSPRSARPGLASRIRWWLRTGALLAVIGVLRLARTARTRWEPLSLLAGALLMVTGLVLPAAAGAFLLGLVVLIAALLKGIREQGRRPAR